MGTTFWPKDPLEEADLNLLSAILHRWCDAHGHQFNSTESQHKAKELVEWFEFGIKDEAELESLINGQHPLVTKIE
ncbi:hypothetical protein [Oryzifoliimicrobium ureilyticus]|uniref:hypothetical protein n=1 Tax=Oryzifoliimicrobium ureilyticus TaxID=3113724 RepID=UPI0030761D25